MLTFTKSNRKTRGCGRWRWCEGLGGDSGGGVEMQLDLETNEVWQAPVGLLLCTAREYAPAMVP